MGKFKPIRKTIPNDTNLLDVILEILERGIVIEPNHKTRGGMPYNINTGFSIKLKDK